MTDYDELIRKVEIFTDQCRRTTQGFHDVMADLGKDFEDLGDFSSAMATMASFGTAQGVEVMHRLADLELEERTSR